MSSWSKWLPGTRVVLTPPYSWDIPHTRSDFGSTGLVKKGVWDAMHTGERALAGPNTLSNKEPAVVHKDWQCTGGSFLLVFE